MMYTRFRPLSLTCLPIASCGPSFCHDAEKRAVEAVLTDHADRPRERRDEPDFHAAGGRRGSRGEHGREHENDQGVRHDGVPPGWLDSWRIIIPSVDAAQVKQLAKDLG